MRIVRESDGFWVVHVDANELPISATRRWPHAGAIGTVNQRGTVRVWRPAVSGVPRNWRRIVTYRLQEARRELINRGEIRDRGAERRLREERRSGSFIARLNDGQEARFNTFPRARDWAEEGLKAGRATLAEFYRDSGWETGGGTVPTFHDPDVPFSSFWKNEYGRISGNLPTSVGRAYQARRYARMLQADPPTGPTVRPDEKAGAWDVAADAFEEAGIPYQVQIARRQAAFWRKRSVVRSRRRDVRRMRGRA